MDNLNNKQIPKTEVLILNNCTIQRQKIYNYSIFMIHNKSKIPHLQTETIFQINFLIKYKQMIYKCQCNNNNNSNYNSNNNIQLRI